MWDRYLNNMSMTSVVKPSAASEGDAYTEYEISRLTQLHLGWNGLGAEAGLAITAALPSANV